ncbi:hypothetical protein TKK_0017007 [Trichogramma kaykai]
MGFSTHYLCGTSIKTLCLACEPLDQRHTADYLKNTITATLEKFEISQDKVVGFVIDAESAIRKAAKELFGDRHIVCLAHTLALVLKDAVKELHDLNRLIDKVKSIVALIKKSIPASDELKALQMKEGTPEGKVLHLIQEVPTRWNSKIDMINRYIELEKYIYLAMKRCDNPIDLLSIEEMVTLKDVRPIMQVVNCVITELSSENNASCSVIIPLVNFMKQEIEDIAPNTDIGKKYKANMEKSIESRFKNFERSILAECTLIDPRFKKVHFKDGAALVHAINKIRNRIKENASKLSSQTRPNELSTSNSSSYIWKLYDKLVCNSSNQSKVDWSTELDQFLHLPTIPLNSNIFEYWKNCAQSFPVLSEIALKKHIILSSSVPSERIFSIAGLVKRDNRNRLTGNHLNMLLFLSSLPQEYWELSHV